MNLITLYSDKNGDLANLVKKLPATQHIGEYLIHLNKIYRIKDIGHDFDRDSIMIKVEEEY